VTDEEVSEYVPRESYKTYLIDSCFKEVPDDEGDIWIERILIRHDKTEITFFSSHYTGKRLLWPPTGARTIIYLDDRYGVEKPPLSESERKKVHKKNKKLEKKHNRKWRWGGTFVVVLEVETKALEPMEITMVQYPNPE
jgi:hypothetical protein